MKNVTRLLFLLSGFSSIPAMADGLYLGLMAGSEQLTEDTRNFVSKAQFTENPSSEHVVFDASSIFIRAAVRKPLRTTGAFANFVGLAVERVSSTQITHETISTTTTLKLDQDLVDLEYGFVSQLAGSIGYSGLVAYGYGLRSSGSYVLSYKGDIPDESTSVSGSKGRTLTVHPGLSWSVTNSLTLGLNLGYRWSAATFTKDGDISPVLYAFSGYSAGLSVLLRF